MTDSGRLINRNGVYSMKRTQPMTWSFSPKERSSSGDQGRRGAVRPTAPKTGQTPIGFNRPKKSS